MIIAEEMNLEELVKILNNGKPTICTFTASWCNPCKAQKPALKEITSKYNDKINFIEIDVENNDDLVNVFVIRNVPFTGAFLGNKEYSSVAVEIRSGIVKYAAKPITTVTEWTSFCDDLLTKTL